MYDPWSTRKVLITARTYPTPSQKGIEVSCTAGITDDGKWIRLFPIPYRFLSGDKRFAKYQWIEVRTKKARDFRPESFTPDLDSIKIPSGPLPTTGKWKERKEIIYPLKAHCLCCLQREQAKNGSPTLGFFKPRQINAFVMEQESADWTPDELAKLRQFPLFGNAPSAELEKIPYTFKYKFSCDEPECAGHVLSCTDWEMGQAFRSWRTKYGANWEQAFRQTFEHKMISEFDTHFFVGTVHQHPNNWIIVGLFRPPQ